VALLISLFTAGMKLALPLKDKRWRIPVQLATVSMVRTVAAIAAAGVWLLNLPLGATVLLGAILAPTDPVLASNVQVANPGDRDRLRFGLTGEGGLNDGTAFPLVMLGLGLLGTDARPAQRRLMAWFGIRGIGSLYDLLYAISHGIDVPLARQLLSITLAVIVTSVIAHGVSVTPLMKKYERRKAIERKSQ